MHKKLILALTVVAAGLAYAQNPVPQAPKAQNTTESRTITVIEQEDEKLNKEKAEERRRRSKEFREKLKRIDSFTNAFKG